MLQKKNQDSGLSSFQKMKTYDNFIIRLHFSSKNLFRIYGIICTKKIFSMIHNYTSNVSREQFELIREDLENARKRTRPRTVDLYEVFCGVLYVLTTGCQWRNLPSDFPNWQTVYFYYQIWRKVDENGISLLEKVHKKISCNLS